MAKLIRNDTKPVIRKGVKRVYFVQIVDADKVGIGIK